MTARRFPPPWSVEELETCFVVKGQCRGSAEAAELFCSGNSKKLHNTFDAFEHFGQSMSQMGQKQT
jgi:hypothetical protein